MLTTFHRAVDMTVDPVAAVRDIIECGCDKILTSGAAKSALEGAATIQEMGEVADGRLEIIAAGGVTETNAVLVLAVSELGLTADDSRPSILSIQACSGHPSSVVARFCCFVCFLFLLQQCGPRIRELHGSLRAEQASPMKFRKQDVWMGGEKANCADTEFVMKHASADRIRQLLHAVSATTSRSYE